MNCQTYDEIGVGGADSLDVVAQVAVVEDGDVVDGGIEDGRVEVAVDLDGDHGQVRLGRVPVVRSLHQQLHTQPASQHTALLPCRIHTALATHSFCHI